MNEKAELNDDTNSILITSTICRNCIFAEYNNDIDHNRQIGCKANRLEKFKKAKISIIEMTYDDTTSYVVEGKTCVYYRNKEWAESHYGDITSDVMISTIQKELHIPYHIIVFFRANDTIDMLKTRLSELSMQKLKPKMVTVIDRSHHVENQGLELMQACQEHNFKYWRVQTIQAIDTIDPDVLDLVYDNTKSLPYMFYMFFECKYEIPIKISEEIHQALHDDMKSFTVLLPNAQGIGGGALKIAHKKHAGNSFGIPLEEKIRHYDDAPHLIKQVEEICPSLKTS